jgi:hypothetical protein
VYYKDIRPSFLEQFDVTGLKATESHRQLTFVARVDLGVLETILAEVTLDDLKIFRMHFLKWMDGMKLLKKVKEYELSETDSKTELRAVLLLVAIAFTNLQDQKKEMLLLDYIHLITNDPKILAKRYSETIHCFSMVIIGISESPVCCVLWCVCPCMCLWQQFSESFEMTPPHKLFVSCFDFRV